MLSTQLHNALDSRRAARTMQQFQPKTPLAPAPEISLSAIQPPTSQHPDKKSLEANFEYKKDKVSCIMGFITSVSRCVRDNKLSRRLSSNNKPQRLEDDYNDLVRYSSNKMSLARAGSMASGSTAVHHSSHEPIIPIEPPTQNQKQPLSPAQLSLSMQMQALFDNEQMLDFTNDRAARALSRPEYPILKLDTVQSPFDTPTKKLQAPIETGQKMSCENPSSKRSDLKRQREEEDAEKKAGEKGTGKKGSKLRRSMTGLFRKTYSFRLPRSPVSMKNLRSPTSPRWIDVDASSLAEEECLVSEKEEEKWLEAHGIGGGRDIGIWTGGGMEKTW